MSPFVHLVINVGDASFMRAVIAAFDNVSKLGRSFLFIGDLSLSNTRRFDPYSKYVARNINRPNVAGHMSQNGSLAIAK